MPRHHTPRRPATRRRGITAIAVVGGMSVSAGVLAPMATAQGAVTAVPPGSAPVAAATQAGATAPQAGATAPQAGAAAAKKVVYLSFDDGPHSTYTPKVLKVLDDYNVYATFFELGQNVSSHPSLTRRVDKEGHAVQNHTWSHPDLTRVSWSTFKSQVGRTDRVIRAQTGYTPKCLRPPYGSVNGTVRSRAKSLGKTVKLWTVDPRDWARPGSSVIASRVLKNVKPGSIILLHDGGGDRSQMVAALPTILRTLKSRGYGFYRMWC